MQRKALAEKIMVVGVDGFDPSLAKKFLNKGEMPNLQAFIDRGACREDLVLLGAMPTVTPPMWTTLATGAYASTHGITGFFNHHPQKLDTVIYALDSRMCQAEPLWNVFAEAGKKTLVWHWPGSSWPPTSDSPNLHVVDGTQPNTMEFGTAMIDWDKLCVASTATTELHFLAHDAPKQSGAGCVITDLEDVVAVVDEQKTAVSVKNTDNPTGAAARKVACGGLKEINFLVMNEQETEINLLTGSSADLIYSPIKAAEGWLNAPADAKEFTIVTSGGYLRRPCLILKNAAGVYDHLAIYKNKKMSQPLITVFNGQYTPNYVDEIFKGQEKHQSSRCLQILELSADGNDLRLWIGHALDLENANVWHPKTLRQEVFSHCGATPLPPQSPGSIQENVTKLLLPGWDNYTKWQADCLTYLMDHGAYEMIFSHIHNVDALGHKLWHYAKYRDQWQNDEAFYHEAMLEIYRQTDRYLGRFLPYLDRGWTIMILSDHGLITEENQPPILAENPVTVPVMQELGYTVLKKDENGQDIREVDWSKTRAIIARGGQLYLNLQGRHAHGIVDPADQYELEREIITALYNYCDPRTGKRVVAVALRNKDAILLGEGGPECGDIIVFMEEGFNIIHADSLSTQKGYYDTSVSPIFVAAGQGIKAGYKTQRVIRQVDVTPTLAILGGVRMPTQCEGAVVHQILSDEF